MPDQNPVESIRKVADVKANGGPSNDLSLESLALLLCTSKVKSVEENTKKELKELRQRQSQVKFLHQLLNGVNSETDAKGNFKLDNNSELKGFLEEASKMGVKVDTEKTSYTKDERDRLIENIRMTCDDLNIQNEMQLQTITRLTNERYEVYQMARAIMKPLHEDKINKARSAGGR